MGDQEKHSTKKGADSRPVVEIPAGAKFPFIPSWLRDAVKNLSGAEAKVLLIYISRAGKKDGIAYPSIGCLRNDCRLGVNAVKAPRTSLVKMGFLEEISQERDGGRLGRKSFKLTWK